MLLCNSFDNEIRWNKGQRLHHLFEQQCDRLINERLSEHAAVITDSETLSYCELDQRANQLAHYLLKKGLRPGDRIGLLFDKSVSTYVSLLAVLKIDAAYVPLDASFPNDRINFICSDSEVKAILSLSSFSDKFTSMQMPVYLLDTEKKEIGQQPLKRLENLQPPAADDQLCYIIYTSGSTGNPKGVAIEHSSICNFVSVAGEVYGITDTDRMYQGMTIAFDFSIEEIWVPLIVGATLVPGPSDTNLIGDDLADFLEEKEVTAMCCVPTLLATINRDLPKLHFILVSGEACPHDLVVRWHRPDRRMLNAYGPTEATVTATWTELHPDKPVTIGGPLPTYIIVILDTQNDRMLGNGEMGEVCIAGIGLAKEYINRKDLTAKSFISDFLSIDNNPTKRIYRTGDLGQINKDNEIEYHGRIDTQVKIRGYRIELTEIESALLKMPGIAQAVVDTHIPNSQTKELVAYYTLIDESEEISQADIFHYLKSRLPGYMVPAYLEKLDTIPMLPSHKADRKRLPPPATTRFFATNDNFVAPETQTEIAVADAVSKVLKMEKISLTDDFFDDLGAHSLLVAQFSARIRDNLPEINVSMRDIYLNPTVKKLAGHIDERLSENAEKREQVEFHIASDAQHRLCGAIQFLHYAASSLVYFTLSIVALIWVLGATSIMDAYIRSVSVGTGVFLFLTLAPVALKWVLIGRWTESKIPIWSLRYIRYWIARQLIDTNPVVMFKGTPVYNMYLRLLGAKIGSDVVILTRTTPVCPDLLSIGDGSILRKEALATTYKAESGYIYTGRVTIGKNAVVAEASVLDIDSTIEDNAQLGHASMVRQGHTLSAGKNYHGAPARETDSSFDKLEPVKTSALRKLVYCSILFATMFMLFIPSFAVSAYFFFPEAFGQGVNLEYISQNIPTPSLELSLNIAVATLVFYLSLSLTALATASILPRILNLFIKPGKVYPLYGFHYYLYQIISAVSNSTFLNNVFGDSSFAVYYQKWIGYSLSKILQTGSNFGSDTRHDNPLLCNIGTRTMVSDGLSMVNVKMSSSSFMLCPVNIGSNTFLGNKIQYPSDAKVGENVLLATKVMVPTDGPVSEGVGLLGSPAFEIPRSVVSAQLFDPFEDTKSKWENLRKKNLFNLRTIGCLMLTHWLFLFFTVLFGYAVINLYGVIGLTAFFLSAIIYPILTVLYFVCAENLTLRFQKLKPYACTIHDPYFWQIERNWKIGKNILRVAFKGTPFRPIIFRMLGSTMGKKIFDDGSFISEESLTTIGDYCCLNDIATIQPHSLEDGMFKSDYIVIGDKVTLGLNTHTHYGTKIDDNAILDTDSFLMKGSEMKASSLWRGNPAQEV